MNSFDSSVSVPRTRLALEYGTEVEAVAAVALAGEVDAGEVLVHRDRDERVGLVVAQADVEAGPVLLDEALLGQQGLGLGGDDDALDLGDLAEHRPQAEAVGRSARRSGRRPACGRSWPCRRRSRGRRRCERGRRPAGRGACAAALPASSVVGLGHVDRGYVAASASTDRALPGVQRCCSRGVHQLEGDWPGRGRSVLAPGGVNVEQAVDAVLRRGRAGRACRHRSGTGGTRRSGRRRGRRPSRRGSPGRCPRGCRARSAARGTSVRRTGRGRRRR